MIVCFKSFKFRFVIDFFSSFNVFVRTLEKSCFNCAHLFAIQDTQHRLTNNVNVFVNCVCTHSFNCFYCRQIGRQHDSAAHSSTELCGGVSIHFFLKIYYMRMFGDIFIYIWFCVRIILHCHTSPIMSTLKCDNLFSTLARFRLVIP